MSRGPWNDMAVHGPRLGDRVRLGDTGLTLEVMADDRLAGDELLLGFAKTGRDGIGFRAVRTTESCDVVVTNVLMLDPVLGVRVTSIGIREGRIIATGARATRTRPMGWRSWSEAGRSSSRARASSRPRVRSTRTFTG